MGKKERCLTKGWQFASVILTVAVTLFLSFNVAFAAGDESDITGEINQSNETAEVIDEPLEITSKLENSVLLAAAAKASIVGSVRIIDIFPDSNLALVVAKTLRGDNAKVTDTVTQANLNTITILVANGITVHSIEGIQYLNNVQKLSFENCNEVSDLTPFSEGTFNSLQYLYLRNNKVTDLSPLDGVMPNLKELYFENGSAAGETKGSNQVSDLSPLRSMPNLERISGEDNGTITSLAPLENHTKLTAVYFKNNMITSIEPLKLNVNMKILLVEGNNLTSIAGVENMFQLQQLSIYDNLDVADISALANKTELTQFWAHNNKIEDISSLANLTKLVHLTLAENRIRDLSPLKNINPTGIYNTYDQTIVLDEQEYSPLTPLIVENIIINKNGSEVTEGIVPSNEGIYSNGDITWTLERGITAVTYTWNSASSLFSGTVTIPLAEIPTVEFIIHNSILDFPEIGSMNGDSQNVRFIIKMMSSDGVTEISPSENGLPADGSFVLEANDSITLYGMENGTYTVEVMVDDALYATTYDQTHGSSINTDIDLPSNKIITGTFADGINSLDIKNRYTYWSDLEVISIFLPESTAEYAINIKYPDGTTATLIPDDLPFEKRLEIGTEFDIIQNAVSGYESSANLTQEHAIQKFYAPVNSDFHVTGSIEAGENIVQFTNILTKQIRISNEDISKYPNINQQFVFDIKLSRQDYEEGMESAYKAMKYSEDGSFLEEIILTMNGTSSTVAINDGEYLLIDAVPLGTESVISQQGVSMYTTHAEVYLDERIVIDGSIGDGLEVSHTIQEENNDVKFINETEYEPPVTGIFSGTDFLLGLLLVIASFVVFQVFRFRIKKYQYSRKH